MAQVARRAQVPQGSGTGLPAQFQLTDRTIVLTGAAGFIGSVLARGFLEAGARVVLMSRAPSLAVQAQAHVARFGPARVAWRRVDFADRPALVEAAQDIVEQERVDVLVNNAQEMGRASGFNLPDGTLERAGAAQWDAALGAVHWAALLTQTFGEGMKQRGRGVIINMSSMYGLVGPHPALYEGTPYLNPAPYSAAKAALIAFTRYVAAFWGPFGIRCNALAPGPFPSTGGTSSNSVGSGDQFLERVTARTLLRRVGRPEELVGPAVFLASDASSYMTGHTLVVDGGWTVT